MLAGTVEVTLFILLVAILAGPMLAERFRVPGLLGLIFLGMLFGPFMLDWLGRLGLVEDLGSIGILYLMFLAGLGFNLQAFAENRTSALVFGLAGFAVPFVLSLWVSMSLLGLELIAAALVGAMWASNTLVAYPDVRSAGLADNRAVRDAVSAGVVADLLSLLVLAVATSHVALDIVEPLPEVTTANAARAPSLPLWITVPLLAVITLWFLPKVGEWFFVRVGRARVQRFLFALVGMAAGASLAVMAGVEGLIGAFLAGLGLNRLVPKNSELMDRLDFVGSTIFIPAFLVSIGLSIDPAALFDAETLLLALVFTGLVVVGKTIAVSISAAIYRLSVDEAGLMASLSYGQAASTLAIAQVGFNLGLFDQKVVNAAVLTVVFTALATSFGTRFFMRRVPCPVSPPSAIGERVLVDVRPAASNLDALMEFAGLLARSDDGIVIPYTIPAPGQREAGRLRGSEAEQAAAAAGHDTSAIVRVSESFVTGTLELIEESDTSLAVLSWPGPRISSDYVFGSEIDGVGEVSPVATMAVHLIRPWSRVVLVIGDTSVEWHTEDAVLATSVARRLRRRRDAPVLAIAADDDITGEDSIVKRGIGSLENVELVSDRHASRTLLDRVQPEDLVVAPAYVLRDTPITEQLRLARRLAQADLAIVAGPGRLVTARSSAPHRMERLLGPQQ